MRTRSDFSGPVLTPYPKSSTISALVGVLDSVIYSTSCQGRLQAPTRRPPHTRCGPNGLVQNGDDHNQGIGTLATAFAMSNLSGRKVKCVKKIHPRDHMVRIPKIPRVGDGQRDQHSVFSDMNSFKRLRWMMHRFVIIC